MPGNHDTAMDPALRHMRRRGEDVKEGEDDGKSLIENGLVLVNQTASVGGLTVFGSPYTLDPFRCSWWAYKAKTEEGLDQLMVMPEGGVDVVVTHSPPRGVGDYTVHNMHAGSQVGELSYYYYYFIIFRLSWTRWQDVGRLSMFSVTSMRREESIPWMGWRTLSLSTPAPLWDMGRK